MSNTVTYIGQVGYNVLNTVGYSATVQAGWIGGVVASGQSVMLASPLPGTTGSMFAIEAGYLASIGYVQVGGFMVPPVR